MVRIVSPERYAQLKFWRAWSNWFFYLDGLSFWRPPLYDDYSLWLIPSIDYATGWFDLFSKLIL